MGHGIVPPIKLGQVVIALKLPLNNYTIAESYRSISNESSIALASITTIEVDAFRVNVAPPANAAVRALVNIWKEKR